MFAEVIKLNKITGDEVYRDTRAARFEDTISVGFIEQIVLSKLINAT